MRQHPLSEPPDCDDDEGQRDTLTTIEGILSARRELQNAGDRMAALCLEYVHGQGKGRS